MGGPRTTRVRLSATGLEVDGDGALHHLAGFLDRVLRGVGQVMFQNNSYTGLLFLIGIGYNSLLFAAAVVVGTVVSTLTAMALEADRALVRAGCSGSTAVSSASRCSISCDPWS